MSKFSVKKQIRNYEGEKAYALTTKQNLYSKVCTSLLSGDKFYESENQTYLEIVHLIKEVAIKDPEFILKLAAYARNEMNMRTIPIILLGEAADIVNCKKYIKEYAPAILKRADEPAELVSYWILKHGSIGHQGNYPFPNSLKKGLSDVLNNLTEYQVNKYNRTNRLVTLKDILRICHPKPKNEKQNSLFRYILFGEIDENLEQIRKIKEFNNLKEFDEKAVELIEDANITWEMAISKFGNKKEVWDALSLPFMAMLRNLSNMLNCNANMEPAINALNNKAAVKGSKQFPFRFYSAYKQIEENDNYNTKHVLSALSNAITTSIERISPFSGRTVIACDNSGSMQGQLSHGGGILYKDIANLFGALIDTTCENSIVYSFGTEPALVNLDSTSNIFDKMKKIEEADIQGGGTEANKVLRNLIRKGIYADRIIVLSDMQCYFEGDKFYGEPNKGFAQMLREYKRKINPDVKTYSIDLASYGTSIVESDYLNLISGWSDRIIDLIKLNDEDLTTAIEIIEKTTSSFFS